ncbi:protein phosphatase 1 regulatory subunit 3C [Chanos chanos]|uniref:Protein phosphatase 1 regulatory subunit 3C n=1 Tax=Chanos chanos TaxID=29144 RepID=A0A6J2UTZ0_CHACN|nr:protein phosphatase 1 regulatory subunit 3C-like [Chanos chanos]
MSVDLAMHLGQGQHLPQFLSMGPKHPLQLHFPTTELQLARTKSLATLPVPFSQTLSRAGRSGYNTKKKRVVFADAKGLSLTAVRVFTADPSESSSDDLSPSPVHQQYHTLPARFRKQRQHPGFLQPHADLLSFRTSLQEALVQLESCSVTDRVLSGTVRVFNISSEKAVHVRITFDTWRTYRDVPCSCVHQQDGGSDTDLFTFSIPLPAHLDPRERTEFCISYRPAGLGLQVWDNNRGQNYRVYEEPAESGNVAIPPYRPLKMRRPAVRLKKKAPQLCLTQPDPTHHPEITKGQNWGSLANIALSC